MKLQKIGGYASIGSGILLVISLVIFFIAFPRIGLVELSDWTDPIKGIDAASASPITFFILNLVLILWGIDFILIIMALRERMQASAPNLMRIAVIGVSFTCVLWLAEGLIGIVGIPSIVSAKDVSAFRAVMAIFLGLDTAAGHALGWGIFLIGWAALKTGRLPKILSYGLVVKGIVMILQFVVFPLTLMMVGVLLGIIFYPWLGIVLLRSKS